jgi:tetratricopeptide (TPR) repeat protein
MSAYFLPSELEHLEVLKQEWKFIEAMRVVNRILFKDPRNEEALLQVADIKYRAWEIEWAEKAIDFLNDQRWNEDPMWLYVKGVLEMEKNNRKKAKPYLQKAIKLTQYENHEILRCYGLCEYWYGNREKWLYYLESAFDLHSLDAEVIYNLIELYLLEQRYKDATKMITYYRKHHRELETFDKDISYYDYKVWLFEKFLYWWKVMKSGSIDS